MARARWAATFIALGLAAAFGNGCAEGPRPAVAPTAAAEPEPTTIEEAQAQLARARAALGGLPTTSVSTPVPKVETEGSRGGESGAAAESRDETTRRDTCSTACSAMASMKRAVEAICRMAGEDDPRCVDARKTMTESRGRVSACGC